MSMAGVSDPSIGKTLTLDEARHIASNIAKLPAKSPDVILIDRHDAGQERDQNVANTSFKVCGKTGTEIKISDMPKTLF